MRKRQMFRRTTAHVVVSEDIFNTDGYSDQPAVYYRLLHDSQAYSTYSQTYSILVAVYVLVMGFCAC